MKRKREVKELEWDYEEAAELKNETKREREGSFFKLVWRYVKKYKLWTFLVLISIMLAAASVAVTPPITKELIAVGRQITAGGANRSPQWHWSWQLLVIMDLVTVLTNALFVLVSQYLTAMLGKQIEVDLRNECIEKLIAEDMSFYSNKKIGDILTKVVSDTQIVGDQFAIVPITFLNSTFTFISTLVMMFIIDWKLSFIALSVFVISGIGMISAFFPLSKLNRQVRRTVTHLNGDVIDRINTIKLVKASGTANYETKRFIKMHEEYYNDYFKMNIGNAFLISFLFLMVNSVQMIVVVAAVLMYHNDINKLADLVPTFIISVSLLIGPVMSLVRVLTGFIQAATSSKRLHAILTAPVRFNNRYRTKDGVEITDLNGPIVFKNIEFAYPEKPNKIVFPNFNFTFEQGKSYAFVGETGSGKSTVSKLLLRFYDPTKGQVLINGKIDLKDINLSSYLDHVGYVEQEPAIFLGTVYDNIRYARQEATDEEVIEAAKKAKLHDVIMSWPDGYETVLGERGFMLSGGQKQRLVIARIFLKDPELLILDEATSALDNIVEKEIQAQLDELMKGRTSITIAHRLSTIKNVDLILVLEPGKGVVQVGTWNELKNRPGHFRKLYEAGK